MREINTGHLSIVKSDINRHNYVIIALIQRQIISFYNHMLTGLFSPEICIWF